MPRAPSQFDVAIIGGGHNGLVCASYLAAAGLKVIVLERRGIVGGAAVTEEFHPGFRNSTASYTVSLLNPRIIAELRLVEHGLQILPRPYGNFLPLPDGDYLRTGENLAASQAQFARFSGRDAERLADYYAMLERAGAVVRDLLLRTPPNLGGGLRAAASATQTLWGLGRLPPTNQRELWQLFTRSAGDLLDGWFESAPIKALFGFDSVVGNFASPYHPGSAYVLLHHTLGEVNGQSGQWGHALGGMGAITQAMRAEAEDRGVTVRTNAAVERVNVDQGRATGVTLSSGETVAAGAVAANVNPKLLFNKLVPAEQLSVEFRQQIDGYRCASGTLRINVALDELPKFACAPSTDPELGTRSGIIIAPSLQYMENAYFEARQSGWSREPIIEMLLPSTVDDSLAPPGKHVASLFCQHFNPELQGVTWDDVKDQVSELVFDTVEGYAPGFKSSIVGHATLTPLDLEREFGLTGGDIFHGALSLDQLFSARPLLGYADYRTPIAGLYLCGAGTHPGGGVSGAPGYNAAREMIRDLRPARRGRVQAESSTRSL